MVKRTTSMPCPPQQVCTVSEAIGYLQQHEAAGRGAYNLFLTGHWACLPPEHCTHDDAEKAVFLTAK